MRVAASIKTPALRSLSDVQAALDALTAFNRAWRRAHRVEPLYSRGVRYEAEFPREEWLTLPVLYERGAGDCEDLACARASEVRGARAVPVQVKPGLIHIVVKLPNGKTEDPSARLGMPTGATVSGLPHLRAVYHDGQTSTRCTLVDARGNVAGVGSVNHAEFASEVGAFGDRLKKIARKLSKSRAWQAVRKAGRAVLQATPYGGAALTAIDTGRAIAKSIRNKNRGATDPSRRGGFARPPQGTSRRTSTLPVSRVATRRELQASSSSQKLAMARRILGDKKLSAAASRRAVQLVLSA